MSENRIVEQFKLLKTAKKLEQMGSTQRALEIYLEIHEKYDPNTSDAYERPAILLERYKRYEEALQLCEEAIDEINNDRMSGTIDKFERRIESIHNKMKDVPINPTQAAEAYRFGIVGYRSKHFGKMLTMSGYILVSLILGWIIKSIYAPLALIAIPFAFAYLFDLQKAQSKQKIILMILVISLFGTGIFATLQLPSAVSQRLELESKEESLDGGENIFTPDESLPVITDQHISDAITIITDEIEVKDAVIIVNEGQVTFGLLLMPQTNHERAVELSEEFIEALAHRVSQDVDIKAPSRNNHGELYDFYSVVISAGSDTEEIIARGTKSTSSKHISWRD